MSQSRQEEVRKLLYPPECSNQSPGTGNGTSVRKEGDRRYLRAAFVSCGCAFGLFYPFPLPLTTVQDCIWVLFSPLPLFISFTEAIMLQSEGFRANPILPFYLAVSFFWPCHSCNATLWTKTQRSFLFVRFWLCIPSLSLAFLLSVALAALFSHVEHQAHPPGLLLKSFPPWNMTLCWISLLMQVLSTEQTSSLIKSSLGGEVGLRWGTILTFILYSGQIGC